MEGGISDGANSKKNAWFGAWNGVSNDEDSSGVMEYVRIEFAGIAESPDNELNGLTLAGVGSKTIINNVQVSFSGDDSFEWFGGTVNCKNLIAFNGIDDDFDTDNGYRGKVQFAVSYRTPQIADQSNSEAIESDNDAGSYENTPHTAPIFSNFTLIGPLRDEANQAGTDYNPKFLTAAQIRRNSKLSLFNSLIVGWTAGVEITNQNTVSGFDFGLAELKNNTFIGIKGQKYFYFGSKTKESDKTNANWFNSPENANEFISASGNIANYANISNDKTTTTKTLRIVK